MFNETGIYIGVFFILAGLLNCFFGYKLFKIVLGIIGFIIGGYIIGRIAYSVVGNEMVAIVIGIVFGLVIALVSVFFYYGGVFIIGASFGATIAFMLNFNVDPLIKIAIIIIIAIAGGILAVVFQKLMIIISTSFGGSFLIINGSLYSYYLLSGKRMSIGKYFLNLQKDITFYLVLIIFVLILGIIGIIFQYKSSRN